MRNSPRSFGPNSRRLVIGEAVAIAGVLLAVGAAFAWTSAYVLIEEYYGFFGFRRMFAWSYQEMVLVGALEQLQYVLYAIAAPILLWQAAGHLAPPWIERCKSFLTAASPMLLLVVVYLVLHAWMKTEDAGRERARKFAMDAERGIGIRTALMRRVGDATVRTVGYRVTCSERACLLYQPTTERTQPESTAAVGRTVVVLLEPGVCVASLRSPRGEEPEFPQSC